MMNTIFMKEVKGIGDLVIEHIFYNHDEPILFVCKSQGTEREHKRYLFSCCRLSEIWICAETTDFSLIKMMKNEKTISSVFEEAHGKKFINFWNGEKDSTLFVDKFPEFLLPLNGATLSLSDESTKKYCEILMQGNVFR